MKKSLLLFLLSLCAAFGVCAQKRPLPVATYMNAEGKLEYRDFKASDVSSAMGEPQIVTIRKEVVVDYQCVPNPGNPPTGNIRVYCDSGTGKFTCLTSVGATCISSSGGTVTNVSGTSPIVSSGGTTPAISCPTCTITVASGTAALGTSAISAGVCATVVTVAGTGIATTDNIMADFNADPTAITGYIPGTMLTIIKYPTSGNVNFKVCNNTGGSVTPGAVTLNWRVVR